MCGRYEVSIDSDELDRILQQVNQNLSEPVKTGEIFPTNAAPVLIPQDGTLTPAAAKWGFPGFRGKGVIINARAETAEMKKTFRDSLMERRCLVPASGFYEWDRDKQKYLFKLRNSPVIYMAGLFQQLQNGRYFTILTTAANASVAGIHDRMPLILPENQAKSWVLDLNEAMELLHREPPMLEKTPVYSAS